MRIPVFRASVDMRCWMSTLSPPCSAKPEVSTSVLRTPAAAHCSNTPRTESGGVAMTARSIGAPTAARVG